MRLLRPHLANQIDAGRDVSPLVAAAHLEATPVPVEELQKIVRLEQQVAEFGVRNAFFALEPPVHRFFLQHVIDGKVLPRVAQKRQ